jgi:hypothetical protein
MEQEKELKCKCNGKPILSRIDHIWWVECGRCKIRTFGVKGKQLAIRIWNEWR